MVVYDNIDNYIETLKKALEKANKIKEIGIIRLIQKPFEELLKTVEYMSLQLRYDARLMPIENASLVSENITLEVTKQFGYGGEITKEGWIRLALPPVLTGRKYKKSVEQYRETLYRILYSIKKESINKYKLQGRLNKQTVILKHIYGEINPSLDADNVESKAVIDAVATYFLMDDALSCIDYYACSTPQNDAFLVVYIVPRDQTNQWITAYRNINEELL